MQLGFVIDHSRCIGCHACTVACKAENDVPLGSFRTWVKYTESGTFPEVRRSFAVLRCNQCTQAPCVEICPVKALEKRPDGIVDVDPAACIGCKACMQGCPYDALYLNDRSGTVEKCHFCAHRTEIGLAPACAVVCPTEAIIPGDFHDPQSRVATLRAEHDLQARKPEAGTFPNVYYREAEAAGLDPLQTEASGGYLWAERRPGIAGDAVHYDEAERHAAARTTYNVDHPRLWGNKVSAYLFTKSLAAGVFLALAALVAIGDVGARLSGIAVGTALFFLAVTGLLLVLDLKRPARFLFILFRPNASSWLVRGTWILMAYGLLLAGGGWMLAFPGPSAAGMHAALLGAGAILAALTAAYTGWLFGQAKGRVLWLRRGLWLHLIVQALVAGSGFLLLAGPWLPDPESRLRELRWLLLGALTLHGLFVFTEARMAPAGREAEFRDALAWITRGPFAIRHRALGVVAGVALPVLLLLAPASAAWVVAGGLALVGLYTEEDILVRAGQAPAIS